MPGDEAVERLAEKLTKQVMDFPSKLQEWREIIFEEPRRDKVKEWFAKELSASLAAETVYMSDSGQTCGDAERLAAQRVIARWKAAKGGPWEEADARVFDLLNGIENDGFEQAHDLRPCGHSCGDYRDAGYIRGRHETYTGSERCVGCERESASLAAERASVIEICSKHRPMPSPQIDRAIGCSCGWNPKLIELMSVEFDLGRSRLHWIESNKEQWQEHIRTALHTPASSEWLAAHDAAMIEAAAKGVCRHCAQGRPLEIEPKYASGELRYWHKPFSSATEFDPCKAWAIRDLSASACSEVLEGLKHAADYAGFMRGRDATISMCLMVMRGEDTRNIPEKNIPKLKEELERIKREARLEAAQIVLRVTADFEGDTADKLADLIVAALSAPPHASSETAQASKDKENSHG